VKVTVTRTDIIKGGRMDVTNCAVARAVKRETGAREVIASQRRIIVYPPVKKFLGVLPLPVFPDPIRYAVPAEVSRWISNFDFDFDKSKSQPITFDLATVVPRS
jgi:hypothetical protein